MGKGAGAGVLHRQLHSITTGSSMTVLCASRKVDASPGFPGGDERTCLLLRGDPLGPEVGEVLLVGSLLGLNLFGEP